MRRSFRRRFWVETALAAVAALLTVVTILVPDWLEVFFHLEPDEGSGSFEVVVTLIALAIAVSASLAAVFESQRSRALPER